MNIKEYNICVDNFADSLYRFVVKNIKNSDLANDIVQDSFLKLWEKKENIDFLKSKSYLFTTAYHLVIDNFRKNNRVVYYDTAENTNIFENTNNYATLNEFFDIKSVVNYAIDKLPSDQKAVVLLRDYEGYSYKEIAEITSLSEAQVKVYIYRARLFLKNFVKSLDLVMD